MSKKQSFLKGATILGAAGIFIKILGAVFKIPLSNKIGAVGVAYYMAPYPIYNLLLVIATAGIPTAIARMIAEKEITGDTHGIFRILRVILKPLSVIAVVFATLLFFGAGLIADFVNIPNSAMAFRTIAPALLFVPLMSILRGFFQGIQRLKFFAVSQIIEQIFRVVVGLALAFYLFNHYGPELAAAGATFGASIGSFGGLIGIYFIYRHIKKRDYADQLKLPALKSQETDREILRKLLSISVPITIGASIMPVMNSVDLALVVNRLKASGVLDAEAQYGALTGFAVTIVNFPQILTASLQISLVPAITQMFVEYKGAKAHDQEEKRKHLSDTVNTGLKVALIIGLPCAVGLATMAEPIMLLLFSSQVESATFSATILSILAWDLIFLAVYQATTGILQGLKMQMAPAKNLAMGLVFKLVLTYSLVSLPSIGVKGAAISTIAAFLVASALNVYQIARQDYLKLELIKISIKPIISSLVMGLYVVLSHATVERILGGRLSTLVTILIAGLIYGTLILVTKTLHEEEYDLLPGGSKLKKLAKKLGSV